MVCEYCGEENDGSYGSGRFCSKKCARGFSTKAKRKEINEKVSKKLKKIKDKFCYNCGKKLSRFNKIGILCKRCKSLFCPNCGEKLTEENAYKRPNGKFCSYCKKCFNELCKKRWIKRKIQAIEYKGGGCAICGYNKYYGALEFHHVNPKLKEFSWNRFRELKEDAFKKELNKCVLLCSNCHKEVHAGVEQLDSSAVF